MLSSCVIYRDPVLNESVSLLFQNFRTGTREHESTYQSFWVQRGCRETETAGDQKVSELPDSDRQKSDFWVFPGGPVVGAPCFLCRALVHIIIRGIKTLHAHIVRPKKKRKSHNLQKPTVLMNQNLWEQWLVLPSPPMFISRTIKKARKNYIEKKNLSIKKKLYWT